MDLHVPVINLIVASMINLSGFRPIVYIYRTGVSPSSQQNSPTSWMSDSEAVGESEGESLTFAGIEITFEEGIAQLGGRSIYFQTMYPDHPPAIVTGQHIALPLGTLYSALLDCESCYLVPDRQGRLEAETYALLFECDSSLKYPSTEPDYYLLDCVGKTLTGEELREALQTIVEEL